MPATAVAVAADELRPARRYAHITGGTAHPWPSLRAADLASHVLPSRISGKPTIEEVPILLERVKGIEPSS
jgi:hypothetical protein